MFDDDEDKRKIIVSMASCGLMLNHLVGQLEELEDALYEVEEMIIKYTRRCNCCKKETDEE